MTPLARALKAGEPTWGRGSCIGVQACSCDQTVPLGTLTGDPYTGVFTSCITAGMSHQLCKC